MQSRLILALFVVGLASASARLAGPVAKKDAKTLVKKAKVEVDLAKQELELSKDLSERAKLEAKDSPDKSKKDAAAAQDAMAAGAKAVKAAKEEVAEAKQNGAAKKEAPTAPAASPKKDVAVKPTAPEDPATQLLRVSKGLDTLSKLKTLFNKNAQGEKLEGQEIAEGAMTTELGKKDSAVWSTIMDMVAATQQAATKMNKNATKDEKEAVMKSVEDSLNAKAAKLGDFTKEVETTDQRHSEEYLLGLLMQHIGKWNETEQLDAVKKFSKELPIAKELLAHHDDKLPLAPQLGDLMDKEKKEHAAAYVAAGKAKKMFIQLAASVKSAVAHVF